MLLMVLFASLLAVPTAQAATTCTPLPTISAQVMPASHVPASLPGDNLTFMTMAMAIGAVAKTTTTPKSRKMNLSKAYLFNGLTYGPGRDVDVPDDFPDIDDKGDVIFEEGSQAARNQARDRSMSSPPSTGGVNTGEGQAPASEPAPPPATGSPFTSGA
jgi:hypothetical protein